MSPMLDARALDGLTVPLGYEHCLVDWRAFIATGLQLLVIVIVVAMFKTGISHLSCCIS